MSKNKNNDKKNFDLIKDDAKDFGRTEFKKFKKKGWFDSKKEAKKAFHAYLTDEKLPGAIEFVIRSGYYRNSKDDDVQAIKDSVYARLCDDDYIKYLKKAIKNGDKIKNIKFLPIILKDIIEKTIETNKGLIEKDPNASVYDVRDLTELMLMINKKKLKKMEKNGIDNKLAIDVLTVIPDEDVISISQIHRLKSFFDVLYAHAKTSEIPFSDICDVLFSDDIIPTIIAFALLEKKNRFSSLDDNQKKFYLAVSNWCFKTMETLSKDGIEKIVDVYINTRKKDDSNGKDSARRYNLASLSESEYPRIYKVIQKVIGNSPDVKKYL
jgi:hypothetical protein